MQIQPCVELLSQYFSLQNSENIVLLSDLKNKVNELWGYIYPVPYPKCEG